MKTCPKCNKELDEGTKFCTGCGARIFETIFCPNCGKQTSAEFSICQSCGASIADTFTKKQVPTVRKKLSKKAIMLGGIGVIVVVALILVVSLFSGGNEKIENYALYLKDGEIFLNDLKKDSEAWQLTSRFIASDDAELETLANSEYSLGFLTYMSEDGKYIFFPDKNEDDGINLYYKKVTDLNAEAIKIDSGIGAYSIDASGTIVTYLKGEEGNLYQYKIGEDSKDKIASEVQSFNSSDDEKKIAYINSEDGLYLKNADMEEEKIASNVSSIEYITEDFTTIYYIKEDSLYKQVIGEEQIKISANVHNVIKVYDSGEIYYITRRDEESSLMDYVIDDMKDADASITDPMYPEYPDAPIEPYWWEYDIDAEYDAAYESYEADYEAWEAECDRIDNEYEIANDEYLAKESRDELRENLEEETLEQSAYSLCFYNGAEKVVLTDALDYSSYSNYTYAFETPVISYGGYNPSDFEKVKLSEVESIDDVRNMVVDTLYSYSKRYIAVKDSATVVEQEKKAGNFIINTSGTIVYYVDDVPDEKDYGTLYRINISDGVVGKSEVYDNDVYESSYGFVSDSEIRYLKDCQKEKGELYINKNKIDYDVKGYDFDAKFYSGRGQIFYFTDWNSDKECGTLKVYDGKESVKIADNVHGFSVTSNGNVLYLCEYSLDYYNGEMYEWFNGETRKIDDDVNCIIPIYDSELRDNKYKFY